MPRLYETILGPRYAMMPRAVQDLHRFDRAAVWRGHALVRRGKGWLGNVLADLLRLPRAADYTDVTVSFTARDGSEVWDRSFNGRRFRSVQWQKNGVLYERLFLTTLAFDVTVDQTGLNLHLRDILILGVPVQKLLRADVMARETETDGRFHFHVRVVLPVIGLLVEYDGFLERA